MRRGPNQESAGQPEKRLGHRPFEFLHRVVRGAPEQRPAARVSAPDSTVAFPDSDLFLREVANVVPLDTAARQRVAVPPPARPARPVASEEAETLAQLDELVAGKASFDISATDEYLEGVVVGLDPRVVRKLRRGEFVTQSHLDLHGMTADRARIALERFLAEAYRAGRRCVLIVHGRGRNSKDQVPVLKTRLKVWLARGQWSRLVLAFSSARPCDGGTGALYVLLRRDRASKRTIRVVEGTTQ